MPGTHHVDANSGKVVRRRTICEVHREIYDILYDHYLDDPHFQQLVDKLQESYTMAKKMNAKLRQYKYHYDTDWWETMSKEIIKETLARRTKRS